MPGFDPGPVSHSHWHWANFSSKYFHFALSVSFHKLFVLIFISITILSEGQAGEAWEPSKRQYFFLIPGSTGQSVILPCFCSFFLCSIFYLQCSIFWSSLSHSCIFLFLTVTMTNYHCLSWILLEPHPECRHLFTPFISPALPFRPDTISLPSAHVNVNSCIVDLTAAQLLYNAEMGALLFGLYCTVQTALKCYLRRHQERASNCRTM